METIYYVCSNNNFASRARRAVEIVWRCLTHPPIYISDNFESPPVLRVPARGKGFINAREPIFPAGVTNWCTWFKSLRDSSVSEGTPSSYPSRGIWGFHCLERGSNWHLSRAYDPADGAADEWRHFCCKLLWLNCDTRFHLSWEKKPIRFPA